MLDRRKVIVKGGFNVYVQIKEGELRGWRQRKGGVIGIGYADKTCSSTQVVRKNRLLNVLYGEKRNVNLAEV